MRVISLRSPSDHGPAMDGVTELRVHGVGGTAPADLLEDPHPVAVAGDDISGFWRTTDRDGRHVEAYSWGGLTSRSATRVLWLLLLPFALVNLAGWMRRPSSGARPGREPASYRSVVRVLALTTTLVFVMWPIQLAMDAIGYQCGGQPVCVAGHFWLSPFAADWLAAYPGRRIAATAVVPVLVLLLLGVLARRSRRRYEQADPMARAAEGRTVRDLEAARMAGLHDPCFWQGDRLVRRLGRLHLAGGFTLIGLVLALGSTAWTPASVLGWTVTALSGGLLVVIAVAVSLPSRVTESQSGGVLGAAAAAFGLGIVAAVASPPAATRLGAMLPGLDRLLAGLFGLQVLLLLALVALLGVQAWRRTEHSPGFRWGGPVVAATLGVVLLVAVTAAINVRAMDALGQATAQGSELFAETVAMTDEMDAPPGEEVADTPVPPTAPASEQVAAGAVAWLTYPPSFDVFAMVFTVGSTVLALAALGCVLVIRHRRRDDLHAAAEASYADEPPPEADDVISLVATPRWREVFIRPIVRWRLLSETADRVDAVLSVTVASVLTLASSYALWRWAQSSNGASPLLSLPPNVQWLASLSSWVMALLPVVALVVVRAAYTDPMTRRRVATVFDVVTFWPRAWHPLAPPSYPERAVPELARRMVRIAGAQGRTLLSAHSQGTVLAAAALAQLPADVRSTVAVVTYGSPLGRLYRRYFPAYFGGGAQRELRDTLARDGGEPRWRNFYRLTDAIGGPVFDGPDACPSDVGPDIELRDPETQLMLLGDPPPRVRGHLDYHRDATFVAHVDELVAQLQAELRPVTQRPHSSV